jgi:riboflavin kinase / FMN adenylyltransferase
MFRILLSIMFSQLLLHRNMKVYSNIDALPIFSNAVITTGSFDGVHTGHVQIINQLIKEAEKINGTPVLITFYPHPKQVVQMKEKTLHILNTPEEKYALLQANGIKNIVVVPFDKVFSQLTAEEYIEKFLVEKFKPSVIVVGYDHRFGNNREGNFDLLKSKEAIFNFEVKEIPEHVLTNITISSTKIRTAILEGDIEKAASYLGYDYFFNGKIIEGNKLGRTIGYPTANLQIEDEHKLIPANGVYAVDVQLNDTTLKGMMNIGMRPTVDGKKRTIEVNIFDFDEDIYGQIMKVTLKKWLRAEVKFAGLDELKNQLAMDAENAKEMNK